MTATSEQLGVNVYYGANPPNRVFSDGVMHGRWNSNNVEELAAAEAGAVSMDQLMHFDCDGMAGAGIFELLRDGRRLPCVIRRG